MATLAQLEEKVDSIVGSLDNVATDVKELVNRPVPEDGLTKEETEELFQKLSVTADKAKEVADTYKNAGEQETDAPADEPTGEETQQ